MPPKSAAIWNWKDDTWTFRELSDTRYIASGVGIPTVTPWSGLSGTWATLDTTWQPYWNGPAANPTSDSIHSVATLAINNVDDTFNFEGSPMTSKLEKVTMDLGDPESVKIIDSVVPRITADAGTPFVRVYAIGSHGWYGAHHPLASVRVMDEKTFLKGHYNPQEGGPKGMDIDNSMNVMVITSAHQRLAFFDLPSILNP